jgi:hypothetical protein
MRRTEKKKQTVDELLMSVITLQWTRMLLLLRAELLLSVHHA